ncbi:hypothetical protein pv_185 [Pithovirus sibericum]|uniref:Uncharacterized protein n=1 Tax=Pithovirus sibericum TaxID=1450746 RepID=W5S616_9VIRU|nr:hypothetical protein pv_185 [Pithovirus sibericum]AHH01752.1 hypothetical protein pv_185 [Pithovirus sibericum]
MEDLMKELQELRQRTEKLEKFVENIQKGCSDQFILPSGSIFIEFIDRHWCLQMRKPIRGKDYTCSKSRPNVKKWLKGKISKEALALIDTFQVKVRYRDESVSLKVESEDESDCYSSSDSEGHSYYQDFRTTIPRKAVIIINGKYSCEYPLSTRGKEITFDLTDFLNQTFQRILLTQE